MSSGEEKLGAEKCRKKNLTAEKFVRYNFGTFRWEDKIVSEEPEPLVYCHATWHHHYFFHAVLALISEHAVSRLITEMLLLPNVERIRTGCFSEAGCTLVVDNREYSIFFRGEYDEAATWASVVGCLRKFAPIKNQPTEKEELT